jgi:hypothetical protein
MIIPTSPGEVSISPKRSLWHPKFILALAIHELRFNIEKILKLLSQNLDLILLRMK